MDATLPVIEGRATTSQGRGAGHQNQQGRYCWKPLLIPILRLLLIAVLRLSPGTFSSALKKRGSQSGQGLPGKVVSVAPKNSYFDNLWASKPFAHKPVTRSK
jgi:hypothetical protein